MDDGKKQYTFNAANAEGSFLAIVMPVIGPAEDWAVKNAGGLFEAYAVLANIGFILQLIPFKLHSCYHKM